MYYSSCKCARQRQTCCAEHCTTKRTKGAKFEKEGFFIFLSFVIFVSSFENCGNPSLTLCPRCHSEPQAKNLAFVTVRKTRCFAALSMTSLPYAPFSSSRGERKLMVHFVVGYSSGLITILPRWLRHQSIFLSQQLRLQNARPDVILMTGRSRQNPDRNRAEQ